MSLLFSSNVTSFFLNCTSFSLNYRFFPLNSTSLTKFIIKNSSLVPIFFVSSPSSAKILSVSPSPCRYLRDLHSGVLEVQRDLECRRLFFFSFFLFFLFLWKTRNSQHERKEFHRIKITKMKTSRKWHQCQCDGHTVRFK